METPKEYEIVSHTPTQHEDVTLHRYRVQIFGWPHEGFVSVAAKASHGYTDNNRKFVESVEKETGLLLDQTPSLCINDFYPYGRVSQEDINNSELSRKGIPSRLLSEILGQFSKEEYPLVSLASPVKDSHSFYEKNGFALIKNGVWWGFKLH